MTNHLSSLPPNAALTRILVVLYSLFMMKLILFAYFRYSSTLSSVATEIVDQRGQLLYFPVETLQPVRTFVENTNHFQVKDADEEWASLIPGDGLVYLGKNKQPYTMSMIHQLRCIDIVRKEIVELEANPHGLASRPSHLSHHCVNYMRQMVLCRGDLDFDAVGGKPRPAVFPDSYQCADWEAVYRAVEQNQQAVGLL